MWSATLVLLLQAVSALNLVGLPRSVPLTRRPRLSAPRMADDLAKEFAREASRRRDAASKGAAKPESSASEAPYTGIREIVLDDAGKPKAIPRRPPPPPASTMGDEVRDLTTNPQFLFGVLISAGSLVLLLAIAGADQAASM